MGITRINNNLSAATALRNIDRVGNKLNQSIERLSSGLRINRSADDAAGLSVANRLRTQMQGLNVAVANAQDGINLINIAEGALDETTNRLNRIRELSLQAANTGVNDFASRLAIQDEVFQNIEEITRIANTTQFGSNYLLNGDYSIQTELKSGQRNIGLKIDASPVAGNLDSGTSFLNLRLIQAGSAQIAAGDLDSKQQILNTGIQNLTDIAVSMARFSHTSLYGSGVSSTTQIAGTAGPANRVFFNGVSIYGNDVFVFDGVLADGVTHFNGSLSIAPTASYVFGTATDTGASDQRLIGAINAAIDNAEKALFGVNSTGSVPTAFRTTVSLGSGANSGRLLLFSEGDYINQSEINIKLVRNGNIVTQANGVSRSGEIGAYSALSGVGQIGNSLTAITGSTFSTGQFTIEVSDVQAAQQRSLSSAIAFLDKNGTVIDRTSTLNAGSGVSLVLNGKMDGGVYTGGVSLQDGDTLTLKGVNADGTTFRGVFTFDRTPGVENQEDSRKNDFRFSSISGLIQELNYRTRDYTGGSLSDGIQSRFEDALFTYVSSGVLQLVDDIGRSDSQLAFTLTYQSGASHVGDSFTLQDDSNLVQEGFAEQATFSIDGGQAVRGEAGQVVTLYGPEPTIEGIPQPQLTLRLGSGFTTGTDTLKSQGKIYGGSINSGAEVTFYAGSQNVVFKTRGTTRQASKFITIDFDAFIDVPDTGASGSTGKTVFLSTTNSGLNFQVGANANQSLLFTIGDLKADNLGFGRKSGKTVKDIDVTTLSGANQALKIIDESLDQVNRTRSILGASTNRLQSAVSSLSVTAENLSASESRIRDADIAAETSQFVLNQVLLQAGVSVLAQANFQSQGFLALLR